MKKTPLETKIKQSGEAYFAKKTEHLQFTQPLPIKAKPFPWKPILTWGTPTAVFGLSLTVMVAILIGSTQHNGPISQTFTGIEALNEVSFPPRSQRIEMRDELADNPVYLAYRNQVETFFQRTANDLFATEDNLVYSPLSAYVTLSLLLEAAEGETASALSEILAVDNLSHLREATTQAFIDTYLESKETDNENSQTVAFSQLANGVFVREDIAVNPAYLFRLANDYFAEVFHTAFDDQGKRDIASWMNGRTFDFLKMKPESLSINQETVLSLLNTLYVKANWLKPFQPVANPVPFLNTASGTNLAQVYYMQKETPSTLYLDQPQFTLVADPAFGEMRMVYVLPKGDRQPVDLLSALNFPLLSAGLRQTTSNAQVLLTVPKTTIQGKLDLKANLQSVAPNLSVLFDSQRADLSKALTNAYVQNLSQHVRIEINETGLEAAAITEANAGVTSFPNPPTVSLTLNRSYLYFLVNRQGLILFAGVVHQPNF